MRSMARTHQNTIIISAGRPSDHSQASQKQDNQSEKSILREMPTNGKILQTSEIAVEYHSRSDVNSDEFEMQHV